MKLGEVNVGDTDRNARLLLGVALLVIGLVMLPMVVAYVLILIGIVLLVTGWLRTCGAYSVLGISTVEKKGAKTGKEKKSK